MMGRLATMLAAAALVGCAAAGAGSAPVLPSSPGIVSVAVSARALPLRADDVQVQTAGTLRYLGGLVLSSDSPIFGGISGLRKLPDGRLLAISDRSNWIILRTREKNDYLLGVSDVRMAPLLNEHGTPLAVEDRDSESLEVVPHPENATGGARSGAAALRGADVYVSFERKHRIWLYRWPAGTPIDALFASSAQASTDDFSAWLQDLPLNGGIEAHAIKATAKIALAEERLNANGGHDVRLTHFCSTCPSPDWTTHEFGLAREDDYKPTDAHWLPNPTNRDLLLVLFRAFSPLKGVRAKLKLFDLTESENGKLVPGDTLATLEPPLSVDNMEALAVEAHADRAMIYLASDNNFNGLQRTLLMKFEWVPQVAAH